MWKGYFVDYKYAMPEATIDKLVAAFAEVGLEVGKLDLHTDDEIVEQCQDADVLLCTGNPPITRKVAENLPNLKVVQRFGIGFNSLDLDALREKGILALYLPGVSAPELSVHATSLILDLLRHISWYDREIRQGRYQKGKGTPCPVIEEMTLGLFGFGAASRQIYKIFHDGFCVKRIIACYPYVKKESIADYDVELVSFEDLLRESDVLSIHALLSDETFHIFNYENMKKMKPSALLINISRGGLVCQDDLVRALKEGVIAGAGLDVYETEPLPGDSPLTKLDNVVMTPHSAFLGVSAERKRDAWSVENLRKIINENCIEGRMIANRGVQPRIKDFVIK